MQKNRGVRSAVKTWVVDKMQLLSEERWKNVEALASLLKSPVVILLGLIGFPGWNGAFGLFMPVTWVAVIVYILAAAAWIFLWIRFGQSLKRDCILVISVVVFACGHFHWMMRSASATYLMAAPLQLGKDMVFAKNYEFFGREVRLIPLDKNWKWSLVSRIYAPSLQTQFLKTTASESGNSIDNSVEVALADGTDPTMDSKWRRLNLPRWTITRSAEVDETIDPIRFVPSPNAKDDNLSLITPARAGLPGLFSTPVGDFELSESWRRAIFQMELFNALKETPTDLILKTLELEAARQANDNILLQSTAIRLLLVRRLANGRFFTPHLKSEMVRAIRMAEHRKWSESNPWFPTLISAMREVNADIISDGKASGNLIEIAARPNADENNWSADNWLKKASPAWLDRSTPRDRTDEEEEQFRTNFAGAMRLGRRRSLNLSKANLSLVNNLKSGTGVLHVVSLPYQ
ncbi:MAG: hypothetical protein IPN84_04705 [Sphingomonadales bacterium]|nr:hypothetical protein [Sphingomonadales bacterium]